MKKPVDNAQAKSKTASRLEKGLTQGFANKLFRDALDRHPDLGWLADNPSTEDIADWAKSDSGHLRCLFSPDYHGNSYQQNLYRVSRQGGHHFSAISAREVLNHSRNLDSTQYAQVFHQHWLKEIFSGRKADKEGMASIRTYFDNLRCFQSAGGKILWTVHNLFDHDINEDERELNLVCLKEMAGIADTILVHSSNTIAELQAIIGKNVKDKSRLLKHSLYDSMCNHPQFLPIEYRLGDLPPGIKFLMFGMLRPYKGGSDLLQEFFTLLEAGELENATLIIAGQVYDPALRHMLDSHGHLRDRVVLIDRRISDTELASLCRVADASVLPYRKILISGSYYQAVTFGLPCIVPDIGMFRCEVEDGVTGIKYEPGRGLGAALKQAYSLGTEKLQSIGQRALTECSSQAQRMISLQFRDLLESVSEHRTGTSPGQVIEHADSRPKSNDGVRLSFCIPVMNRLDDLKATLAKNLEDNRESKGRVEFIVVCFDHDDRVEKWIKRNFKTELDEEYLRFYRADPLEFWHFGRAKSAFKDLIRGSIYASLDGDNFTGYRGGEHIIDVFEKHDYKCVFHQFQGAWGDGTCGRVSLSRDDYLDFGYDEHFLPRQWDEMDAMLSPLVQRPDRTYVCYEGKSIIDKSHPFKRYLTDHGYFPPVAQLDPESDPLFSDIDGTSVGLHDNNYVRDDLALRYSSVFNHLQSFFKNSNRDDLKIQYVSELVEVQRQLVDEVAPATLERWVLRCDTELPADLSEDDIVVLACVKNESDLSSWYEYYKRLGVTRFLIVDDGSDIPVKESLPFPDVYVWTPIVGQFRHAKAFWLEILLAGYCSGLWCLTIDGDEFISLPFSSESENSQSPLRRCVSVAENADEEYFCGFLLDLVPAAEEFGAGPMNRESFRCYQYSSDQPSRDYRDHNTVRWSYGDQSDWAFSIDVRYRMNASLDSLRKFPIIRYRKGMHLNQGFHDLIIDAVKRSPADLARPDLIPILHYKLWVLSEAENAEAARGFDAYHHETRENLKSLVAGLDEKLSTAADSSCIYPYLGYALIPTPGCQSIEVILNGDSTETYEELALRRAGRFNFRKRRGSVSLSGYEIAGPSIQSVIDWLCQRTPFCEVVEQSDQRFLLSVRRSEGTDT